MLSGNCLGDGVVLKNSSAPPWGIFAWLDDLFAVDTPVARETAQNWVFDWINRYGKRQGPGWTADLIGCRVIHWIHHALLILQQRTVIEGKLDVLNERITVIGNHLTKGTPIFTVWPTMCTFWPGTGGRIRTGNRAGRCYARPPPEGIGEGCDPAGLGQPRGLRCRSSGENRYPAHPGAAFARQCRALRMGDGTLTRFHGCSGWMVERIDRALSDAMIRTPAHMEGAVGYSRLAAGGTVILAFWRIRHLCLRGTTLTGCMPVRSPLRCQRDVRR